MKANLFYGVPPRPEMPKIPGFSIIARRDEWLLAEQAGKLFYIEIIDRVTRFFIRNSQGFITGVQHRTRRSYRLFPRDQDGALRADKAITIPV